jgi:hypothetical protein
VSPGCAEAFNLRGAERKCTNCTEDAFTLRRGVSLRCSATALMRSLSIMKKGRFLDAADLAENSVAPQTVVDLDHRWRQVRER